MSTACLDACPVKSDLVALPRENADRVLALRAGDVVAIDPYDGLRISCVEGAVWVTQAGDPRDTIVRGARAFAPAPHGRIVIQSLRPTASVRLATA
jgi:hypothetical protein